MYKYKNKKGYILLEVICSIGIFSILSLVALKILLGAFKVRQYNNELNYNARFFQEIKNNIQYNNVKFDFDKDKELYIPSKNIKLGILKKNKLQNISTSKPTSKIPYIIIKVNKNDEKGEKIFLNMILKDKKIKCNFYKEDCI